MRDLCHFHFYDDVPLALVKGRERTYLEHFWNDFAADPKHSVAEADRRVYAKAYAQRATRGLEKSRQDHSRYRSRPRPKLLAASGLLRKILISPKRNRLVKASS